MAVYLAYVDFHIRLTDVKTGRVLLACDMARNSQHYLPDDVTISNKKLLKDAHHYDTALGGSNPVERIQYVLNKAVAESLAQINQK